MGHDRHICPKCGLSANLILDTISEFRAELSRFREATYGTMAQRRGPAGLELLIEEISAEGVSE